jgi:ABC-type branched-subunit amino acid transport system ATPase component
MKTLIIKAEGKKLKSILSVLDALDIPFSTDKDDSKEPKNREREIYETFIKMQDKRTGFDQFEGL